MVGWHHCFCGFGVDGHELVRGVEAGGRNDGLGAARVVFEEYGAGVDFIVYDKPGVGVVIVFS